MSITIFVLGFVSAIVAILIVVVVVIMLKMKGVRQVEDRLNQSIVRVEENLSNSMAHLETQMERKISDVSDDAGNAVKALHDNLMLTQERLHREINDGDQGLYRRADEVIREAKSYTDSRFDKVSLKFDDRGIIPSVEQRGERR